MSKGVLAGLSKASTESGALASPGSGEGGDVGRAHPEVEGLAGPLEGVHGDAGLEVDEAQVRRLKQREHVPPHHAAAAVISARGSFLATPLHCAAEPAHPLQGKRKKKKA